MQVRIARVMFMTHLLDTYIHTRLSKLICLAVQPKLWACIVILLVMVSATTYFKHVSLIHLCKCLVRAISSSPESSRMGCIQNISLSSRVAANPAKFACKLIVAHVSCRSANRWTTRKGAQESLHVAFHSHFRIARASLNNDVGLGLCCHYRVCNPCLRWQALCALVEFCVPRFSSFIFLLCPFVPRRLASAIFSTTITKIVLDQFWHFSTGRICIIAIMSSTIQIQAVRSDSCCVGQILYGGCSTSLCQVVLPRLASRKCTEEGRINNIMGKSNKSNKSAGGKELTTLFLLVGLSMLHILFSNRAWE